jgi:hypothetical protein
LNRQANRQAAKLAEKISIEPRQVSLDRAAASRAELEEADPVSERIAQRCLPSPVEGLDAAFGRSG